MQLVKDGKEIKRIKQPLEEYKPFTVLITIIRTQLRRHELDDIELK